eukprot:1602451-Rhodomonas_salina.1
MALIPRVFSGTVLRCTVRVLLRACYVVSGTGVLYAATPSSYAFATPGLPLSSISPSLSPPSPSSLSPLPLLLLLAPSTLFQVLTSAMLLVRGFQY